MFLVYVLQSSFLHPPHIIISALKLERWVFMLQCAMCSLEHHLTNTRSSIKIIPTHIYQDLWESSVGAGHSKLIQLYNQSTHRNNHSLDQNSSIIQKDML